MHTGGGIEQKDKGRGVENLRHPDGDPQFFDLVLFLGFRVYGLGFMV
jgi:hypothetical protein